MKIRSPKNLLILFLTLSVVLNIYLLSTRYNYDFINGLETTSEPEFKGREVVLSETPTGGLPSFTVSKVVDGDTVVLSSGQTVRYIGIDAPEVKGSDCFAEEATNKNKELVEGKQVRLEKDVSETDRYGRSLRYIFVGEIFVNDALVREGFSSSATYPPDVKYQAKFREAEVEARENKRGLWGSCPSDASVRGTSSASSPSNSSMDDKDCKDFKTQAKAQEFFVSQGGPGNDPHKLDSDKDGQVCESLP